MRGTSSPGEQAWLALTKAAACCSSTDPNHAVISLRSIKEPQCCPGSSSLSAGPGSTSQQQWSHSRMEGRNERKRKKSEMDAERGGDKEEEFKEREKKKKRPPEM